MYKLLFLIPIWLTLIGSPVFALDKFMNYKNISSAQSTDEDVPVVPDENYALEQGYINTYVLTANANKAITVPTGSKYVVFAANADIWVRIDGAASVPSGDTTDGTGSELNPNARYLGSETTIGIISESAAKVSVMFYK
jgi:hypothetical protein